MSFYATEQAQTFGQSIKAARTAHRWTMRTFARMVGISHVYLCNIEHAIAAPPSDPVLQKMAELLEIPQQTLFALAGRLPPAVLSEFWRHPAVPAILSTVPGMTLPDAHTFCAHVGRILPVA
jgi:transcriptional regulator with XRE-family HTH domain